MSDVKMITGIVWESRPGYAKVHFDEEDDEQPEGGSTGFTTDWLPMIFKATLSDKDCNTLEVDSQVMCLMEFNEYSRGREGVILGSIFSDEDTPPEGINANQWVKEFADGTRITYDKEQHKLTADVKGSAELLCTGDASIKASRVLIDTDLQVTGNITVLGDVDSNGTVSGMVDVKGGPTNISLSTHTHSGVTTGAGVSGPPVPGV